MASVEKLTPGRYMAKQDDGYDWMNRYKIIIDLKETDKSIIIQKIEMIGRYLPAHIEMLFQNGDKVVINKTTRRIADMLSEDGAITTLPSILFRAAFHFTSN